MPATPQIVYATGIMQSHGKQLKNRAAYGVGHMFSTDDKLTLQTLYWLVNFYEGKGMHQKAEQIRKEIDRELDDKLAQRQLTKFHWQAA
jgi:hypothetical protein